MISFSLIATILGAVGTTALGGVIGGLIGRKLGREEMNGYKMSAEKLKGFQQQHNARLKEILEATYGQQQNEQNGRLELHPWAAEIFEGLALKNQGKKSFFVPQPHSHDFYTSIDKLISEDTKKLLGRVNSWFLGYFKGKKAVKDLSTPDSGAKWQLILEKKVTDEAVLQWNTIYHVLMETIKYTVYLSHIAVIKASLLQTPREKIDKKYDQLLDIPYDAFSRSVHEAHDRLYSLLRSSRSYLGDFTTAFAREVLGKFLQQSTNRQTFIDGLLTSGILWQCVRSVFDDSNRHVHLLHIAEVQASFGKFGRAYQQNFKLLVNNPFLAKDMLHDSIHINEEGSGPASKKAALCLIYQDGPDRLLKTYSIKSFGNAFIKAQMKCLYDLFADSLQFGGSNLPSRTSDPMTEKERQLIDTVYELGIGFDLHHGLLSINRFINEAFATDGRPGRDVNVFALLNIATVLADLLWLITIVQGNNQRLIGLVEKGMPGGSGVRLTKSLLGKKLHPLEKQVGPNNLAARHFLCPKLNVKAGHGKQYQGADAFIRDVRWAVLRAGELSKNQVNIFHYVMNCCSRKFIEDESFLMDAVFDKSHVDVMLRAMLSQLRSSELIGRTLRHFKKAQRKILLKGFSSQQGHLKISEQVMVSAIMRRTMAIFLGKDEHLKRQPFGFAYAQFVAEREVRLETWQSALDALHALFQPTHSQAAQQSVADERSVCEKINEQCGLTIASIAELKTLSTEDESSFILMQRKICAVLADAVDLQYTEHASEVLQIVDDLLKSTPSSLQQTHYQAMGSLSRMVGCIHFFVTDLSLHAAEFSHEAKLEQLLAPLQPFYRAMKGDKTYAFDVSGIKSIACLTDLGKVKFAAVLANLKAALLPNDEGEVTTDQKSLHALLTTTAKKHIAQLEEGLPFQKDLKHFWQQFLSHLDNQGNDLESEVSWWGGVFDEHALAIDNQQQKERYLNAYQELAKRSVDRAHRDLDVSKKQADKLRSNQMEYQNAFSEISRQLQRAESLGDVTTADIAEAAKQGDQLLVGVKNVVDKNTKLTQSLFDRLADSVHAWKEQISDIEGHRDKQITLIMADAKVAFDGVEEEKNSYIRDRLQADIKSLQEGVTLTPQLRDQLVEVAEKEADHMFVAKINAIKARVDERKQGLVSDCQGLIDKARKVQQKLEQDLKAFAQEHKALKKESDALELNIKAHSQSLNQILAGIEGLKKSVDDLKTEFSKLKAHVKGDLQERDQQLQQAQMRAKQRINEDKQLDNRVHARMEDHLILEIRTDVTSRFPFEDWCNNTKKWMTSALLDAKKDKENLIRGIIVSVRTAWNQLFFDRRTHRFVLTRKDQQKGSKTETFLNRLSLFIMVAAIPRSLITRGSITNTLYKFVSTLKKSIASSKSICVKAIPATILADALALVTPGVSQFAKSTAGTYLAENIESLKGDIQKRSVNNIANVLRWWAALRMQSLTVIQYRQMLSARTITTIGIVFRKGKQSVIQSRDLSNPSLASGRSFVEQLRAQFITSVMGESESTSADASDDGVGGQNKP